MSDKRTTVTLMEGDGIGPEVTGAVRRVFEAAGCPIDWEPQLAGAEVFKKGVPSGVPDDTIESIARNGVALKAPLETPVGYGEKSANVTLRKLFELYGNIRPTRELPGVNAVFAGRNIDLVVVRENVEDLYAGIEHMQTPGVAQCLKLISRKGCEKIVRLAFELARAEGRKTVHCATKANIMKFTEGLLKRTFEDIAPEYSEIQAEHIIIDNCAHQLVRVPESFDVIVTTNMNGDIISDLTSGLTGGLGLAPSANMGSDVVMFEAVHGSAPTIAGKNIANPTAMLLSGVMMLRHLGHFEQAQQIELAIMYTLEHGQKLTVDLVGDVNPASTDEYTDEVINNLGKAPHNWQPRAYKPLHIPPSEPGTGVVAVKERREMGFDLFIEEDCTPEEIGGSLDALVEGSPVRLKMISNRGTQVYPATADQRTDCVDHWRCRFVLRDENATLSDGHIIDTLNRVGPKHRWMHIEKLEIIDGAAAYSKAQGEN
ncbi:MAG: NADP-dependent isocitrate dehydrogenase [Planctomycetota bacterium]